VRHLVIKVLNIIDARCNHEIYIDPLMKNTSLLYHRYNW